jgi:hypothetical protein
LDEECPYGATATRMDVGASHCRERVGPMASHKPKWGRRIWRSFFAFALLVVIAHALWIWSAHRRLNREIAKLRASGEPMSIDELPNSNLPDSQNASLHYLAAGKLIDEKNPEWSAWSNSDSYPHSQPGKRRR